MRPTENARRRKRSILNAEGVGKMCINIRPCNCVLCLSHISATALDEGKAKKEFPAAAENEPPTEKRKKRTNIIIKLSKVHILQK